MYNLNEIRKIINEHCSRRWEKTPNLWISRWRQTWQGLELNLTANLATSSRGEEETPLRETVVWALPLYTNPNAVAPRSPHHFLNFWYDVIGTWTQSPGSDGHRNHCAISPEANSESLWMYLLDNRTAVVFSIPPACNRRLLWNIETPSFTGIFILVQSLKSSQMDQYFNSVAVFLLTGIVGEYDRS